MGLATRKKGKEYRKEATYKYALLKAKSLCETLLALYYCTTYTIMVRK